MTARAWLFGAALAASGAAEAQEARLLQEMTEFTGTIGHLGSGAPAFVLAAVSRDDSAVAGFGEIADGSGKKPDGDTLMRIGSVSKAFCGVVLADMAARGELALTDRLVAWMRWLLSDAANGHQEMRAIDRAAWLWRDGLSPVSGLDDGGGDMDAMGPAWVIRLPEGNLPLTISKTGGLQGVFSDVILAPGRGAGGLRRDEQVRRGRLLGGGRGGGGVAPGHRPALSPRKRVEPSACATLAAARYAERAGQEDGAGRAAERSRGGRGAHRSTPHAACHSRAPRYRGPAKAGPPPREGGTPCRG